MTARQDCLPPEGCDGGFHWLRYSGTETLAQWIPGGGFLDYDIWRSFGGREFEPGSALGRAHTYLGPVTAWGSRVQMGVPTREEVARVLCGAEGSPCACATRNYEDGFCCSDRSWAPGSPLTAADAVLRLLGANT